MASNHSSYKYSTVGRWLPQEPLETAAVVINPRCITANLRNRQADDSDVAFDLKLWWPIRIRIGLIERLFKGKTHWHRTMAFSYVCNRSSFCETACSYLHTYVLR